MRIVGGQPMPRYVSTKHVTNNRKLNNTRPKLTKLFLSTRNSLYDKVNKCIITSGAFVTEVFQDSNVYFMGELHEGKFYHVYIFIASIFFFFILMIFFPLKLGDQIIEWNGVNLCNRSNEEVQQILLSQLSDEEVEIIYLQISKFNEAYEEVNPENFSEKVYQDQKEEQDPFDTFADMNKSGLRSVISPNMAPRSRYETAKGSIRRKMSLSSIAHMWSK